MPTLVKLPHNDHIVREFGPYRATLNLGDGTTSTQRKYYVGLRGFEPGTQSTLLTLVELAPRPAEFFDIGAHIGMHSLIIASVYPADAVHVTAFEPTPRTAAVARALSATNNLQIRIERCAISDADGTASLYISPWETSNSLMAGFRPAKGTVEVPSFTLDRYCASRGVLPSVIKIDVESYESHVVRGARTVLRQAQPPIVCEILKDTNPAMIAQTVGDLADAGYHGHRWSIADGWIECTPDDIVRQVPHDGNDWLFTPRAVDDRFRAALARWRSAIAECDSTHSQDVPRGRATRGPELYRDEPPVLAGAGPAMPSRRAT